jgi:hypothetical protein
MWTDGDQPTLARLASSDAYYSNFGARVVNQ